MELKKTFLVLSASCVLVALLMLGLVFMICNSISSNFPSGGIEILADGSIVKMETPTETQQNILSMLGIIQIVSCIVLPMGGLALSGILYYHIKLKQPISTLRNGISRIRNHDLDFSIQLGDRTLPVLGLIDTAITINNDGFTNGVQLIVNDEIYCSLLGNDSYSEVYPTLQDNADTDTFESWLDSWCSNYPGTHWLSYLQSSNEMIESFEQIKMLCWVLIIFIGIIGILNIINTVYSNIHTRVGEIGMQRAIGMSAASLYKTFLWEGAYYGIIASVIGAVFGYVCCIFVGAAQTDALQLVAVPVMAIVEAAIISIVACLLATAIPLRSIARMSIVDSIETVE